MYEILVRIDHGYEILVRIDHGYEVIVHIKVWNVIGHKEPLVLRNVI